METPHRCCRHCVFNYEVKGEQHASCITTCGECLRQIELAEVDLRVCLQKLELMKYMIGILGLTLSAFMFDKLVSR